MTTLGPEILDPRPKRFFTDGEGVGGEIKVRPEDFIVEERPLYELSGEGEHLYLRIRKQGVSHSEMISTLSRTFGVRDRSVGYAGMKDKHAITSQTVSVHLHKDPPSIEVDHERIEVLWADRHRNRIRRGHLIGNRFSIRIREVDPMRAPYVLRTMNHLEKTGVPTYFGDQRFGYRRNNHMLGAMILNEEWDDAITELLGAKGTAFPEYQRERRELFDAGRIAEAAEQWTAADRAELIAAKTLRRGKDARTAVRAIGSTLPNFWTTALVSAAFNHVLDRRIEDGTIDQLLDGDLAWKHDSRAVFAVTEDMVGSDDLVERLASLAISPSGPLWGAKMTETGGAVALVENEALAATGVTREVIRTATHHPNGARRAFRDHISAIEVDGGMDEHGPYIRVAFDLPRGIYATVALREIMKKS